jgi:hypothetical protein
MVSGHWNRAAKDPNHECKSSHNSIAEWACGRGVLLSAGGGHRGGWRGLRAAENDGPQ